MKLVSKLSFAITLGVCLVLGIRVWLRAAEERKDFRVDATRDHEVLSSQLAGAVELVWGKDGEARALEVVHEFNERQSALSVKFFWQDGSSPSGERARDRAQIPRPGMAPTSRVSVHDGLPHLLTYAALDLPGPREGALELYETLTEEEEFIARFFDRMTVTTLVLVGLCALVIFGFGVVFVARPLRLLMDKAERIGRGDLTGPVAIGQNDEIREVAHAINDMCERLNEAREQAAREEAARLNALEQLRHADRLRTVGELASGIAHQMGTPLNVVRVRGAMIASGEVNEPRMRELGAIIVEQVDRVGGTIRQLLDFARVKQPTLSTGDLGRLIAQTLRLVEPLANERNVQMQVDVPTDVVSVSMDLGQIHQVLTNLVVNAIHASPSGGAVHVSLRRSEGEVVIAVRDQGEGIADDQLPHIFEPFFTTKRAGEGTGLGLSVARGIVQEHEGRIDVTSARGEGTEFRVILPYKQGSRRDLAPVQLPA